MSGPVNVERILAEHLQPATAPPDLWFRVQAKLAHAGGRAPSRIRWRQSWALAAFILLAVVLIPFAVRRSFAPSNADITFDLGPYLAPVQSAAMSASTPAIYQAPPHFQRNNVRTSLSAPAGYAVAIERIAQVNGQSVRQIIFTGQDNTGQDNAIALFVGSPRIRFDAGNENWVTERFANLQCKRVNCPRMRTVQFPCAAETCVLVCKACSSSVMLSLVSQIASIAEGAF